MDPAADITAIDAYTARLSNRLTLSFQRYPESECSDKPAPPNSYGALPFALTSPRSACLPVRDGEAVWLGFVAQGGGGCVTTVGWLAAPETRRPPRPWSGIVTSFQAVSGLRDADGRLLPFVRRPASAAHEPCAGVRVSTDRGPELDVAFVTPVEYESRAGRPAPAPMSAGESYRGWLLP